MYISLLLDVEDIVTPEADDITKQVADILTDESVRATFLVAGERARQWISRGRTDVIASLTKHDIGVHTDLHSVHPTVCEYLEGKGWEAGVEEAIRREAPAVAGIGEAFGLVPSAWGGPGNTWGPQVNEAVRRLGAEAVVYSHCWPPESDIHRFCGITCYPCGRYAGDADYHDTAQWERNMARLRNDLAADIADGRQWSEVFLGHPSRILHEEFWDAPNFLAGANPPRRNWVRPRRKSDADLAIALENLRHTVRMLNSLSGIEIRTIREMNAMCALGVEEELTDMDRRDAANEIEERLSRMAQWPVHKPDLDISRIQALTAEKLLTLTRVRLR